MKLSGISLQFQCEVQRWRLVFLKGVVMLWGDNQLKDIEISRGCCY